MTYLSTNVCFFNVEWTEPFFLDSEEMYGTPIGGSSPSVVAETPSPPKRRSRLSKGTSAAKSKSKVNDEAKLYTLVLPAQFLIMAVIWQ